MRFFITLMLVLLVATTNAAPMSLPVAEDLDSPEDIPKAPAEDSQPHSPRDMSDQGPALGATQEDAVEEKEGGDEDKDDHVKKNNRFGFDLFLPFGDVGPRSFASDHEASAFRNFERSIIGSLLRLGHELLLGRRLQGSPANATRRTYPYFSLWSLPKVVSPANESEYVPDHDLGGLPGLGLDLPPFLRFPEIPVSNNTNSTYEVQVVNGTRVEVNRTISRESGEGFDSIFQYKVIRIQPEEKPKDQDAAGEDLGVTTLPQLEEKSDGDDEGQTRLKSKEEPGKIEERLSVPEN